MLPAALALSLLAKLDARSAQFLAQLDWTDPRSTKRYRAGQFQTSAWHTAAVVGSLEDMRELMEDEARRRGEAGLARLVELKEPHTQGTALMFAVKNERANVVEFLLQRNASVDAQDNLGFTPLILAASGNSDLNMRPVALGEGGAYSEILRMLLDAGASPFMQRIPPLWERDGGPVSGNVGFTALHYAVLGTNADAVDILVRHRAWQPSYANIQDAEGDSPLMVAALHGRDEIARMLLEANASTELSGTHPQQGTTALCYAATPTSQGAVRAAEHLLAFGADAQARCDEFGSSPLHLLGNNDWEDAVDMRTSAASRNRHFAYDYPRSMPDHVAMARLLIAHGAKLDALDMFGRTALHRAAANGVTPVGRVLLRAGADATLRDSEGMAALDYAKSQRMVGMQRLLLKAREEGKTEL